MTISARFICEWEHSQSLACVGLKIKTVSEARQKRSRQIACVHKLNPTGAAESGGTVRGYVR